MKINPYGNWRDKFDATAPESIFEVATSLFFDSYNDIQAAADASELFKFDVSPKDLREVRIAAACEAWKSNDPSVRRRWAFRFNRLSMDNLAREYMQLEHKTHFLEAKLAFAAELATLSERCEKHELWIAVNDAIGRNNIAMDVIQECIAYHHCHVKIRKLLAPSTFKKDTPLDEKRLEMLAQMTRFYYGSHSRNVAETSHWLASTLGTRSDAIDAADVDFLLDYVKAAQVEPITDEASLSELLNLLLNAVLKKNPAMEQALDGNTGNLKADEVRQLMTSIVSEPLLPADLLRQMAQACDQRIKMAPGSPDARAFKELKDLVSNHLRVIALEHFTTRGDLFRAALYGVTVQEITDTLAELNAMPDRGTAAERVAELQKIPKYRRTFGAPMRRYFKLRWGADCDWP